VEKEGPHSDASVNRNVSPVVNPAANSGPTKKKKKSRAKKGMYKHYVLRKLDKNFFSNRRATRGRRKPSFTTNVRLTRIVHLCSFVCHGYRCKMQETGGDASGWRLTMLKLDPRQRNFIAFTYAV
jgi:hypothetical protein